MDKTSIGDRMKNNYENRYRFKFTRRTPVILRLDGKAFHTLTCKCEKPYDDFLNEAMQDTALKLCSEIQGVKCAYVQSDEISILLTDFDKLETSAWFDYNLQKIISVTASITSSFFTIKWGSSAVFDCRGFNIPKEEVCNYFIWRQQDWFRNSIQMLAQSFFSSKQLHKKNNKDMREMLLCKNVNWDELNPVWKNGTFIDYNEGVWSTNHNIVFKNERENIEKFLIDG